MYKTLQDHKRMGKGCCGSEREETQVKVPKLTIPEYRKEYIKLVESNMRMERKIESLLKTVSEENRLRQNTVLQLIELREQFKT